MPKNNLIEEALLKPAFRAISAGVCRLPAEPSESVLRQVEHELRLVVHVKCAVRFAAAEHGGGQRNQKMEPKYEDNG